VHETAPEKPIGTMMAGGLAPPVGLLLVGHGTRDARGIDELRTTGRHVSRRWKRGPVSHGFLELAEPTIRGGLERLAREGCQRVVAVPVLLGTAAHVKEDIPRAVAEAARVSRISVELAGSLACHPLLVRLSSRRCREAVEASDPVPPARTCLILVGRGSSDRQAAEATRRFAACRVDPLRYAVVRTSFLTAAVPRIDEALHRAAKENWTRVIVQPHLLFRGQLAGQVVAAVARVRTEYPNLDWCVTSHLGLSTLVADALIDRGAAVLQRSSRANYPTSS